MKKENILKSSVESRESSADRLKKTRVESRVQIDYVFCHVVIHFCHGVGKVRWHEICRNYNGFLIKLGVRNEELGIIFAIWELICFKILKTPI